jgi:hypothetical protein
MVRIFHCKLRASHNPTIFAELEPRRQRDEGVDLFVDLGATQEDHGEVASATDNWKPRS